MGVIGAVFGKVLGSELGGKLGKKIDAGRGHRAQKIGSALGSLGGAAAGSMLPYQAGGKINAPLGTAVPILAHGQEYIVPANAVHLVPKKIKEIVKKNKQKR